MKKFLLMMTIFLCMTPTVFGADYVFNGETLPSISNYQDLYYGVETMKNILDGLEITYDDTTILGYTYYSNKALEDFRTNYDENATPLNFIFSKTSTNVLYMTPGNGTFDDDLKYLFLKPEYSGTQGKIFACDQIPGETPVFSGSRTRTIVLSSNNYYYQMVSIDFLRDIEADYQNEMSLYLKYILSPIATYTVAGETSITGMTWYFLANTIEFTKALDVDIPSGDTPESGDTGGGTGGDYIGQLNQIQGTLNNIENKIPTSGEIAEIVPSSGDIEQATQNGIIHGSTEFWGSSGDISGDEQEILIEDELNNFIGTMSGDIAENEIFGILQTYEDKLFGSFTGEEDFKIEWQDVSYMGNVIIPAGSVNFSQICRENEALGNVKSTVNIILTFIILMNIVIYMYNLLLATLGIDNPYLYEKPVGSVTVAEYTDEKGNTYTTTTQHDGRGNSIGRRYQNSTGISSNSRKIGFNVPQYKRWWR